MLFDAAADGIVDSTDPRADVVNLPYRTQVAVRGQPVADDSRWITTLLEDDLALQGRWCSGCLEDPGAWRNLDGDKNR